MIRGKFIGLSLASPMTGGRADGEQSPSPAENTARKHHIFPKEALGGTNETSGVDIPHFDSVSRGHG